MDAAEYHAVTDFPYWRAQPEWSISDASYLLNGFEPLHPDMLDPADRYNAPRLSPRWRVSAVYHALKHAIRVEPPELAHSKAPTPPGQPHGTVGPYKNHSAKPGAIVDWARTKAATPGMEWLIIPPELADIPAPEPTPTEPKGVAIPAIVAMDEAKWRAKLTPKIPEPRLPFQSWRELAMTFKEIQANGGETVNWEYEADQASKGPLQYVERTQPKRPYLYNPEGVALWLHHEKGANARKIGRVMARAFPIGPQWEDKADYWGRVATGEETI